jgi:hypothetical protein
VEDDRRGVLKKMLALGVAAPLAGAWTFDAAVQRVTALR